MVFTVIWNLLAGILGFIAGEIPESKIINDHEIGRSRDSEFVTFSNEKAIWDTIGGINGQNLDGRSVMVSEAQSHGIGNGGSGVGFLDPSQARWDLSRSGIPICSLGGAVRERSSPSVVELSLGSLGRNPCASLLGSPSQAKS
ncbi:hypothetical protein UlMin_011920 [Ulmus minor]